MGFDISALLNPKARSLFGLDISSSAVKMVELTANGKKDGYRVERYTIEVLPRTRYPMAISRTLMGGRVRPSVPGSAWAPRPATSPWLCQVLRLLRRKSSFRPGCATRNSRHKVETEANQYIPFAIDEVNLDYPGAGACPAVPDELEVLIAASKRSASKIASRWPDSAGLKAVVVDVESFSALAAFELIERQLPEAGKNQVVALIDAGRM